MKRAMVCGILMSWLTLSVSALGDPPKEAPKTGPRDLGLSVGEPVKHGNLTIFPVISRMPKGEDRFITLDEGLKAGLVEITEIGAGEEDQTRNGSPPAARQPVPPTGNAPVQRGRGPAFQPRDPFGDSGRDVNSLLVLNKSKKPLYLMPGEILLGGDQDRTVGQELVIAPGTKPVRIPVYCVEHGRWGHRDSHEIRAYLQESRANVNAAASVALARSESSDSAKESNSGKFIGSVGSLSKDSRIAVQRDKSQASVWKEVAVENGKGGVKSKSGAFTGNYAEAESVKRLEPYLETLQKPIAEAQNVVGVIAAVNGKIESMDVFESTPLFKKLWPKLLKSYALDAANAPANKTTKACGKEEAVTFLTEMAKSRQQKSEKTIGAETTQLETDKVLLFSTRHEESARSAAKSASPSSIGGAIHSAGFAK